MVEWWWLVIVWLVSSFFGLLIAGLMRSSSFADEEMERLTELDQRNQLCRECKEALLTEWYSRQRTQRP